ncbi:MAG: ComEA family DNA-binding protein [Phycisphaerales bacterium]
MTTLDDAPPRPIGAVALAATLAAVAALAAVQALRAPDAPAPAPLAIDLNEAGPDELSLLPGVGPSLAARIVEDRASRGPFRTVDDLDRVRGVGPALLRGVRPFARAGVPGAPPAAGA